MQTSDMKMTVLILFGGTGEDPVNEVTKRWDLKDYGRQKKGERAFQTEKFSEVQDCYWALWPLGATGQGSFTETEAKKPQPATCKWATSPQTQQGQF